MRYPDEPLAGLIKECETTLRVQKNPHLWNDDGGVSEQRVGMLKFIESSAKERQDTFGAMTVMTRRFVVVKESESSILRLQKSEKGGFSFLA